MHTPLTTHLLYLHGFRSGPRSTKARQVHAWVQAHRPDLHWWCPQLPPSPRKAFALLLEGTTRWPAVGVAVMGSSLGGFYATALAEQPLGLQWRVGLINPAVDPARDLAAHIGEQRAFHDPDESFIFRAEFIDELRALAPGALTQRDRYAPLLATGDEVLSFAEMHTRYAGEPLRVVQGSDHALSDFEIHLPFLIHHLNLQA